MQLITWSLGSGIHHRTATKDLPPWVQQRQLVTVVISVGEGGLY
jgi:hypothetical protein